MKPRPWLAILLALLAVIVAGIASARQTPAAAQSDSTSIDSTQIDDTQQPTGAPQPDKSVRDPDFGVTARHFGLERRVEMYQWRAAGQGYATTWNPEAIDSSAFAPGHDNPPFPLRGKRWQAAAVTVDGKPLGPEVLQTLGEWRAFRPSFNALPGNLAATFQPQGDGLGSAENPLDPQVGDLRITWRDLVLPPLQDKIVLRDGRWRLRPRQQPDVAIDPSAGTTARAAPEPDRLPWLLGGGVLVVLIAVFAAMRRRRRQR